MILIFFLSSGSLYSGLIICIPKPLPTSFSLLFLSLAFTTLAKISGVMKWALVL